jgi:hypothetical protein
MQNHFIVPIGLMLLITAAGAISGGLGFIIVLLKKYIKFLLCYYNLLFPIYSSN